MSEDRLILKDPDGDTIDLHEVYGFGEPMLSLVVIQDGDESGANVTVPMARELLARLQRFVAPSAAPPLP